MAPPPRPRIEREAAAAAREAGEIDDDPHVGGMGMGGSGGGGGFSSFHSHNGGRGGRGQHSYHQREQQQQQRYGGNNHYGNNSHSNNSNSHYQPRRGGGMNTGTAIMPSSRPQFHRTSVATVTTANSSASSVTTSSYADLARTDPPLPPSTTAAAAAVAATSAASSLSGTLSAASGAAVASLSLPSSSTSPLPSGSQDKTGLASRWLATSRQEYVPGGNSNIRTKGAHDMSRYGNNNINSNDEGMGTQSGEGGSSSSGRFSNRLDRESSSGSFGRLGHGSNDRGSGSDIGGRAAMGRRGRGPGRFGDHDAGRGSGGGGRRIPSFASRGSGGSGSGSGGRSLDYSLGVQSTAGQHAMENRYTNSDNHLSSYSNSNLDEDASSSTPREREAGDITGHRDGFQRSSGRGGGSFGPTSLSRGGGGRGFRGGGGRRGRGGRGRFDRDGSMDRGGMSGAIGSATGTSTSNGGLFSRTEPPLTSETLQVLPVTQRLRGPTSSFGSEGEILSDAELSPRPEPTMRDQPYWLQDNQDSKAEAAPKQPAAPLSIPFERSLTPILDSSRLYSSIAKRPAESPPGSPGSGARHYERRSIAQEAPIVRPQETVFRSYGSLADDEVKPIAKPTVSERATSYYGPDRAETGDFAFSDRGTNDFQRASSGSLFESESASKGRGGWPHRGGGDGSRGSGGPGRSGGRDYMTRGGRGDFGPRRGGGRSESSFYGRGGGERAQARGRGGGVGYYGHGRGEIHRGDGNVGRGGRMSSIQSAQHSAIRTSPYSEMESSWKPEQRYGPTSRDEPEPIKHPPFRSYGDKPFFTSREEPQSNQDGFSFGNRPPSPSREYRPISFPSQAPQQQFERAFSSTPLNHSIPVEDKDSSAMAMDDNSPLQTEALLPPSLPPPPPVRQSPVEPPPPPRPPSPKAPEPKEPSGLVLALTRLADLEAQMEYEYAKHLQLARQRQKLRAEYDVLKTMPLGMEAFQEEYDAYVSALQPLSET